MKGKSRNLAASVRARLFNLSRERGEDFQRVLLRYAFERLLYRLGESKYRDRFILKGAMLFSIWGEEAYRATTDLDLLGYGSNDPQSVAECFREICAVQAPEDGVIFLTETIRAEEIREATEYGGVRVRFEAQIEQARVTLQVDVGYGNAIVPAVEEPAYPVLLEEFPPPRIRAYPRESVLAEKIHAIIVRGVTNSRMKDFYDIFVLSQRFSFDGKTIARAIASTFKRSRTIPPSSLPPALSPIFFSDSAKAEQWRTYLDRNGLTGAPRDFEVVGEAVHSFIWPVLEAIDNEGGFNMSWKPGGPWQ
jgi:predicted nucleotidyltransferase component of viral defense system